LGLPEEQVVKQGGRGGVWNVPKPTAREAQLKKNQLSRMKGNTWARRRAT